MSPPTPASVQITSIESVQVTMSDNSIVQCGSFTNAVANRNAPVQMLHDALAAFFAAQTAAVTAAQTATTTADAAATAAQAAFNTLQGQVDGLVAEGELKTDFPSLQAVLAKAATLSTPARQAAIAALIAKHQATLTELQAKQAALATPSN
jgi:hypothetical protein